MILQWSKDTKKSSGYFHFVEKKPRKTVFYARNKPDYPSLTSFMKKKENEKKFFGEK